MDDHKHELPTKEQFETYYGSKDLGVLASVVYPYYFWWMRAESEKADTPEARALIHSTPRAVQFWAVYGVVLASPVVLVIMWLLLEGFH